MAYEAYKINGKNEATVKNESNEDNRENEENETNKENAFCFNSHFK